MVFKRNLSQIRESKLREFNLKILYNLLPVRSNIFKWGISNNYVFPKCNIKEDMNHAFIECKLIEPFIKHLKEILRDIYKIKILTFSIQHLLKIDCESHCTLFFTIAFWTIYKLIVKRNITGIDKRKVASKQHFPREITNRLEGNSNLKMIRFESFQAVSPACNPCQFKVVGVNCFLSNIIFQYVTFMSLFTPTNKQLIERVNVNLNVIYTVYCSERLKYASEQGF